MYCKMHKSPGPESCERAFNVVHGTTKALHFLINVVKRMLILWRIDSKMRLGMSSPLFFNVHFVKLQLIMFPVAMTSVLSSTILGMLLAQALLIINVQTLDSASSAVPLSFSRLIKPSIIHHKYEV